MSNFAPYRPYTLNPIHVTAYNDMGHLELLQNGRQTHIDTQLYSLVHNDVIISSQMCGGYSCTFYRAKNPNQVKKYNVNGQTYIVDFSKL